MAHSRTGRQIEMEKLLEACRLSSVGDIMRARLFLERAREVRAGCRQSRTASRKSQATASKCKAAKLDQPLGWE